METIYNWLLHNTGNEGNHYTILNTQRNGADRLDVMARTADFDVVNLHIQQAQFTGQAESDAAQNVGESQAERYVFGDEQRVINFLAEGRTPESDTPETESSIRVLITEPIGKAGDVTFPPAQA